MIDEPAATTRQLNVKRLLVAVVCLIAIAGAGGSVYFYKKYARIRANPNLEAQKEASTLISAVGKLIELPKDETPTIATISAKEKLAGQAFFSSAENGDVLFAYAAAMKAILYRPSTNKIINVAPITLNQPPGGGQGATPGAPASLRVAYYNGSGVVGLSGLTEKTVRERYPSYQTSSLANASRKDYTGTLVVDVSGKHSQEASSLAVLLNGRTGSLPQGETIPDADILIISGK